MPKFSAKLSDGRVVDFEADHEPTHDELLSAVSSHESAGPSVDLIGPNPGFNIAPNEPSATELGFGGLVTQPILKAAKPSSEAIGRILAFPAWLARERMEATPDNQPVSKLTEAIAGAVPSDKAIDIATGAEHAGQDLAEFFTSPLGISTLGMGALPKLAQRGIAIGFASHMASQTPEIATQLGAELGKPEDQRDYQKISELVTSGAANTGFAALAGAHGLAPSPKPLGPDMASARRIADMSPEEFVKSASSFNKLNLELGQNATPADVAELTKLRDKVQARVDEAKALAAKEPTEENINAIGALGMMPQFFNEAINAAKPLAKGEPNAVTEVQQQASVREQPQGGTPRGQAQEAGVGNRVLSPEESAASGANVPAQAVTTTVDPIDDFLTRAIESTKPGQVLGGSQVSLGLLKVPAWLAQEAAHGTLRVVRAAYRASKDVAHAISAGIEWLKDQKLEGFNEDEAKAWLTGSLKQEGENTTGIAQRVREKVALAGQEELAPTGEGISAPESVQRGEQLLAADPTSADRAMATFEADPNKAVSAEGLAVVRAKLRQLAQESRRLEKAGGPAYEAAFKARSDWAKRIKPMQTEWHKSGMAQQGEQDVDTGTFTGLREAYTDATGKDFTPQQATKAKEVAGGVQKATASADAAKSALTEHLDKQSGGTLAERRAFDAAKKTVRENQIRLADLETKTRVARTVRDREIAKVQEDAARRALDAANKTVRENAIRLADAENKARIKAASRQKLNEQDVAAQRALDAARDVVRRAAIAKANAENARRIAKTENDRKTAKIQDDAAQKALDAAKKVVRDAAVKRAQAEVDARVNPEKRVWDKVKEYIDKGMDNFDGIRNKVATELGMSVNKVTELITKSPRSKSLADDVWRKQEALRRFKQQAFRWLESTQSPLLNRALAIIPRGFFAAKVFGHGTVALGTHAPMVGLQARYWTDTIRNFGRMYKMVGSPAFYERQMQDLVRRPNYITARRAGLVNDPTSYEDYNSPAVSQWIGNISGAGNRGYAVLKVLRQELFDKEWDQLPKTGQTKEMAAAIADGVNHATGVVKAAAPRGANVALFAPRLEASRAMWLAGDPLRAMATTLNWKNASEAEKHFAIQQVKEKAWVAGTLFSLLALNQAILSATGSKQKVNFDDPLHSDFLKFKVAGMTASYGNPMLSMARLPVRLYQIRESNGGKLRNLVYPDEDTYSVLGEYGRSQLSPFASLATTLWLKGDWQNRPLPSSERPVPKRLRAQGVQPYTWPEFFSEQVLPIPAEEAAREVWKHGMGMSDDQIKAMRKALATIAVMTATGGRLTEDTSPALEPRLRPIAPQPRP